MAVSRFHDLAWAESEDHSRGVIAGALENGSFDLWDAEKLLGGARYVGHDMFGFGVWANSLSFKVIL